MTRAKHKNRGRVRPGFRDEPRKGMLPCCPTCAPLNARPVGAPYAMGCTRCGAWTNGFVPAWRLRVANRGEP